MDKGDRNSNLPLCSSTGEMDILVCPKRYKGNNYWQITADDTYTNERKHLTYLNGKIARQ